jgi:addiction module RelE/StbE family toxin
MASVYWTESALDDAEAIRRFISSDSPEYAQRVVDRLLESTRRLAQFPFSGHVVPEYGAESRRQIICGVYRVLYLVRGDECFIVAVVHASRDFKHAVDPSVWDIP